MSDERGVPRPGDQTPAVTEPMTSEELNRLWADPPGLWGQLTGVQNDKIGARLLLTGFFFLILGGSVDSLVMRLQLAVPENTLISPQLYNELFTNHGSVTMFLVILPIFEGFAILLLPLVLGTREMPFPRLGAFSYWTFLLGGLLYYSSTLFQLVPDAGWFAYTPLSGPEFSADLAIDFWVLGLGVAEVGAIAASIICVLKMRAPGMTLSRMPLFAWAVLVMAFMILFAFTPLIIGSLLLELDRGFGTQFFNPSQGGSSLLWQHLFWIFGHPEVYIQFIPATGVVSMILPVFSRASCGGLHVARRRDGRHRVHVVRPLGASHVHRRPAAAGAGLLLGCQHGHRHPRRRADLRVARHHLGGQAGVEDAVPVRRRVPRGLRDRRHHRRDGRRRAVRPAGARLVLRRRASALRADRRRRVSDLRRRLLLVPEVHRPDAGRTTRPVELLAAVRRRERDLLPDAHRRPRGDAAADLHL
jgi:hypothetical protein